MHKKISRISECILGLALVFQAQASSLPVPSLVVQPSQGIVGEYVMLDASASRHPAGHQNDLRFRYKITDDSQWTEWRASQYIRFRPKKPGDFRALVEVKSVNGSSSFAQRKYKVQQNYSTRTARILLKTVSPRVGQPVTFQLIITKKSTDDADKFLARWDFDGDGTWDTDWQRNKTVSHTYPHHFSGRIFSPKALVKWPNGTKTLVHRVTKDPSELSQRQQGWQHSRQKVQLGSSPIVPPKLQISPGNIASTEDTIFTFDASSSLIPQNAWLEWAVEGKGSFRDKGTKKIKHKFNAPGRYLVTAKTCYRISQPICEETPAYIIINANPIGARVELQAQNKTTQFNNTSSLNEYTNAIVGDTIRYWASVKARAPQATPGYKHNWNMKNNNSQYQNKTPRYTYRWDFNGDNIWDTPFSPKSFAEHTFKSEGRFQTKVEVKNDLSETKDQYTIFGNKLIIVEKNHKAEGTFKINYQKDFRYPNKNFAFIGENIYLQPQVVDRQTGRMNIKTRFDMESDGQWESAFVPNGGLNWKYKKEGVYTITMQLQDTGGELTKIQRQVQVVRPAPPEIDIAISHRTGNLNTNFSFNANKSTGLGLQYYWYYADEFDSFVANSAQVTKRFSSPGQKTIYLRVTDRYGRKDEATFPIWVRATRIQNQQNIRRTTPTYVTPAPKNNQTQTR